MKDLDSKDFQSRRNLLKGVVAGTAGVAGIATVGDVFLSRTHSAKAASSTCVTPIPEILSVAITAEVLAVTFYTQGLLNADKLGISGDARSSLHAALVEEQIHENFLAGYGATPITNTFSFPHGATTFTNMSQFIKTQQQLESIFDSGYLAAVKEFGLQGRQDLAQLAAQIACVEAEHRAIGRALGGLGVGNNYAFAPILIATVGDAPAAVKAAGYFSPVAGNSYTYAPVSTSDSNVVYRTPFAVACKS